MIKVLAIYLCAYGFLVIFLGLIGEQVWSVLYKKCSNVLTLFKSTKYRLPYWGSLLRGLELKGQLVNFLAQLEHGSEIKPDQLARYKFYPDLLAHLLLLQRKFGTSIKKNVPQIRVQLTRDLDFEKKVFNQVKSSLAQFSIVTLTTWLFVFLSQNILPLPLSRGVYAMMLFWQFLGLIIFFGLFQKFKKKRFAPFARTLEELYSFTLLMEASLSLNQALEVSQVYEGVFFSHERFCNLNQHFKALIERLKIYGISPLEECREMVEQIWLMQDEEFEGFVHWVQVVKFSSLVLFYLPAYFLYLWGIFKFFMEQ